MATAIPVSYTHLDVYKRQMIAFLQENSVYSLKDGIGECEATVQIYVGEKEKQSMKKSAKRCV